MNMHPPMQIFNPREDGTVAILFKMKIRGMEKQIRQRRERTACSKIERN